jgi:LuxR family maltose regulon positive regulatory protein
MGEPRPLAPREGGAAELDALLATRLHVPRTRRGLVARPRLVDRLTEGLEGELAVVCAPAGFGKTALLADWIRRSGRAVAWLSLDAGDNDQVRFWRDVAAALEGVRAGVGRRLAGLLRPPPRSFEAVVAALVNELAAAPGELVLVLDGYHLIESPAVHQSLGLLLEHLPAELRLAVASWSDPPLPLPRLRARGQLVEVRAGELRFTPEETGALLREAIGHDLPDSAVAALAARTEGWAAGLQLAALSLRDREDVTGFVASFSGDHRYVLDYLAEEVLERQPERVRTFLLETSVLGRLCGPLCDAVTGGSDGQRLLEAIERANLFLIPLDEVRRWWRYHHLFADLLRVRLTGERPERLPGLHGAAAAWLESQGLVEDAIRHMLAAGDTTAAAELVERSIEPMLGRGETARWQAPRPAARQDAPALAGDEGAAITGWLAALPAEVVQSRPRLCAVRAIQAAIGGQAGALQRWLDTAERAQAAAGGPSTAGPVPAGWAAGSPTVDMPGTVAVLRADLARLRGDAECAMRLMREVLGRLPAGERVLRFNAEWNLARAHWHNGELGEAEELLARLVASAQAAGEHYLMLAVGWELGRLLRAQGRLGAALASCQQALAVGAEAGSPSLPASGIAQLGVAAVLYERDELAGALEHATEGIGRSRQLAGARLLAEGLVVLARIRQALGDHAGAVAAVADAERIGPSPDVVELFNPVGTERARLLLGQGQVAQAAAWAAARGLDASDLPSYPREREYLLLAQLLLGQGQPERARPLLTRLQAAAAAQGRTGRLVVLGAVTARALAADGDEPGALAALTEALRFGCAEGYVRVFADQGAPLAVLLDQLIAGRHGGAALAADVPGDYLARVRAAFQPGDGRSVPPPAVPPAAIAVPPLAEPLTERELQVLALLAAGTPNQQIASLETVKKHVSHILSKLGAANRTQAVARARELGLLR